MPPVRWVDQEVGHAHLGDPRRVARLARLVSDLAEHPEASIPQACGDWAATKAAYRFLDDEAITPAAIRDAHLQATLGRLRAEPVVLVLQDTTPLDCSTRTALVGSGPLARPTGRGVWLHSALAVSGDGVPMGLVHHYQWARDPATIGQRATRRQRPTKEKESQRWLDALTATDAAMTRGPYRLTVADREADIFDLFAEDRPPASDLLIRATHNRRVTHEARYLHDAVAATPVAGMLPVAVGRAPGREPREALLTVRWVALSLVPPRHHPDRARLTPIPVTAILAEEPRPPAGERPIRWLLVTTRRVLDLADAVQCVRWYALRWLVERYHFVLKQGCKVEELQLQTVARLERAVAVYAIVAWRLLWLTYLARQRPEEPCTGALTDPAWQALTIAVAGGPDPPTTPPSLAEAVRGIARLGGFLGRTGDGEPGPTVLWRGLRRLEDITLGYLLARGLPRSPPFVTNLPVPGLVGKA